MQKPASAATLEHARIDSPEVFRLLVESIADYAIAVLDPNGFIMSWNPGAERLKGYTHDEVLGKHCSIFYTAADLAIDKPIYELRVAADTGHFEDEGWRLHKDGSRFWANVTITSIRSENGKLLGFGEITRDLSERRQAELRYKLLVEGVLDYAIFSMDAEGRVTSWNIGAERIKGYKSHEIIGKHFSTFYSQEDRRRGAPRRVLETAATEGHFQGEGWRFRKDGTRFWASVVVTPLWDEDGKIYGYSKVTRDVTERKVLLDKLAQHSEELELRIQEREQSNAELEAFAYSVSHDLRAPLRAIAGFADALNEDYKDQLDDRGREYVTEISSAAVRMNALVKDLLDYGRIGRINLSLGPVDLLGIVNSAAKEAAPESALSIDIPSDLQVSAHPQILTQVLTNLLSNAFKFQKPGENHKVRIQAAKKGSFVRIAVSDNGIGIAPQHVERIWQVFERLHDRDAYPGTGIGLAIVKRAVMRMHGACGVESEVGRGSIFWVELPVPSEEAASYG